MSRQARRQAERRKSPIASVVEISGPQQRADEESVQTRSSGDSIDYSHRFEVQGHWRHYTKGPIFEKGSKPCPRCGECRRVWVPPFVKGPLDKPLMPKVRLYRSIIGSAGAADASHYQS